MGFGFALWLLISLLAISFTGTHPLWALGTAATGGMGLGVYLWRGPGLRACLAPASGRGCAFLCWICRYELFLLAPALLVLLFSNRLPLALSFLALFWLLCLWIGRRMGTGRITAPTPLDLPVLLILLSTLVSLYASVDLRLSAGDLCKLIAAMAFCYGLVNRIDSQRKIHTAGLAFLAAGAGIALAASLVMQLPGAKFPLVSLSYKYLPTLLPRRIQANYAGGTLVFFFPLALWGVLRCKGYRGWFALGGAITGVGLLMTQSRGALLGAGLALVLTGAHWKRWLRWSLPALAGAGGLLIYFAGIERFLDPTTGSALGSTLAAREELWQRALYITQDFPFTGIGMHSFPVVTDLLYPLFIHGPGARVPHAHNLFLEMAVDIGIPGFVAFWALLGAWGGMAWEVLRSSGGNPRLHGLALGLAGGMVAHLVYGITDAVVLGEKAGVVFWAVLGLTAAIWRERRRKRGDAG